MTGTVGRPIGVIGSAHDDTLLGSVGRDVVDAGGGRRHRRHRGGRRPGRPGRPRPYDVGLDATARPGPSRSRSPATTPCPPAPGATGCGSSAARTSSAAAETSTGSSRTRPSPAPASSAARATTASRGDAGTSILGQSGNDALAATTWPWARRQHRVASVGRAATGSPSTRRDASTRTCVSVDVPRRRIAVDAREVGRLVGVERLVGVRPGRRAPCSAAVRRDEWFDLAARSVRAYGRRRQRPARGQQPVRRARRGSGP